ncbi:MAG: fimbrial protein [Ottowia sp.]|nr:fimbrial protein [Ottowia sp.]
MHTFKKITLVVSVFITCTTAAFAQDISPKSVTINFTGKVTAPTCAISLGSNLNVELNPITLTEINSPSNTDFKEKDFSVEFTACPVARDAIEAKFITAGTSPFEILPNKKGAKYVGILLTQSIDTIAPYTSIKNEFFKLTPSVDNSPKPGTHTYKINLRAAYRRTDPNKLVTVGDVQAQAVLQVKYK